MSAEANRITLIARHATKPDVDWNYLRCRCENVAFLDSMHALKFAVSASINGAGLDIERVIVDRAGTAEDFLDLLASIPTALPGDVLMIRDDGSGFLSATGRGGDRVLYSLTNYDVRFYLETQDLVTGRAALPMSA
ncbi:MAG TPA: hypothetical protein VGQ76_02760 [Thermoanaerobaculia bacterium]|jgi:hypothetical protein|nr:hypothetical protein [Thermoanaerobaculia bacterium]